MLRAESNELLAAQLTTKEGALKTKQDILNEARNEKCDDIKSCVCMHRIEAMITVYHTFKSGPLWVCLALMLHVCS